MSITSTAVRAAKPAMPEEQAGPTLTEIAIRASRCAADIGQLAIDLNRLTGLPIEGIMHIAPMLPKLPAIEIPGDPNSCPTDELLDTGLRLVEAHRLDDVRRIMRALTDEKLQQLGDVIYSRTAKANRNTTMAGQATPVPAHLVNLLQIYAEALDQRPHLAARRGRRPQRA